MSEASFYDPTTEPFLVPMNGRDVRTYVAQFGSETLNEPGLLLDIGAGLAEYDTNPAVRVVRLDPQYRDTTVSGEAVAGLAEELPFADDTFDKVVASYSIFHITDDEYKTQAVAEALRVAKPTGSVHIHPLFLDLDAGDKFFPLAGLSFRKSGVIMPIVDIEGLTLEINKGELISALGERATLEQIAGTIVRKYPMDTFKYASLLHTRRFVQALLDKAEN